MKLKNVMEEIADKLKMFTGLNVYGYPIDTASTPVGIVSYPESIDYDITYQRGAMSFRNLPVYLVTDRIDSKSARDQVSIWTDPSSGKSVKTYLDKETYNSCDDIQVVSATFDVFPIAGIDYLVAIFELNVTGEGE